MGNKIFELPKSLAEARISGLPDAGYYIPNFISEEDEERLLVQIKSRPKREWTELSQRRLQNYPARLNNDKLVDVPLPLWLSQPIIPRLLSLPRHNEETPFLQNGTSASSPNRAVKGHIFSDSPHQAPNHVLVNEYLPGQGIMPHEDGPAYHPIVVTVSLGAPIVLDLYEKDSEGVLLNRPHYRVLQERRSLLITTEALYQKCLHGIAFLNQDEDLNRDAIGNWDLLGKKEDFDSGFYPREARTSLTFRDVKGVLKLSKLIPGLALFGRPRGTGG